MIGCCRRTVRFEPAKFATREDAVSAEVEAVEAELRRIDARLRGLGWGAAASRRQSGNLSWEDVAFDRASAIRDADDDGDRLAHQVLNDKRLACLARLVELRQRLVGQSGADGNRRGWG